MTDVVDFTNATRVPARRMPFLFGQGLSLIGLAADMLVIVGISVLTGVAYHLVAYGDRGDLFDFAKVGAIVALFRLIPHLQQHSSGYVTRWDRETLRYEYYLWNFSFLCLLALGFVAKISGTYSRGAIALFYVAGLPLFIAWQHLWLRIVQNAFRSGWVAMRRALRRLFGGGLDDTYRLVIDGLPLPEIGYPHEAVVDGDAHCYSVAAASILAKTVRDRVMRKLALRYPAYHWESNVGYSTPEHLDGICRAGATRHHRISFGPVAQTELWS